jgi:Zn finger protein HypA/HybF involved in hydrogenase expression
MAEYVSEARAMKVFDNGMYHNKMQTPCARAEDGIPHMAAEKACPECGGPVIPEGRCAYCPLCGFTSCGV